MPQPPLIGIEGKMKLTQKQETFCINYFESGNATEAAIKAGYSKRTAVVIASNNLTKIKVINRLQELRDAVASEKIMGVTERKERLSEIARARLTDYVTCGPDRDLVNVGPESPNTAALQEITSRTEVDKDGAGEAVVTKIKLHNPMTAISELNKMERIYDEGTTVNIDNRKIEIIVSSETAKKLTEQILIGVGTGKEKEE
jgi:phage terminase small subunit